MAKRIPLALDQITASSSTELIKICSSFPSNFEHFPDKTRPLLMLPTSLLHVPNSRAFPRQALCSPFCLSLSFPLHQNCSIHPFIPCTFTSLVFLANSLYSSSSILHLFSTHFYCLFSLQLDLLFRKLKLDLAGSSSRNNVNKLMSEIVWSFIIHIQAMHFSVNSPSFSLISSPCRHRGCKRHAVLDHRKRRRAGDVFPGGRGSASCDGTQETKGWLMMGVVWAGRVDHALGQASRQRDREGDRFVELAPSRLDRHDRGYSDPVAKEFGHQFRRNRARLSGDEGNTSEMRLGAGKMTRGRIAYGNVKACQEQGDKVLFQKDSRKKKRRRRIEDRRKKKTTGNSVKNEQGTTELGLYM